MTFGSIICGDNSEVLIGFPDDCIDLVVTSPPYDDLRSYGGHEWNFETVAAQLVRVLKPGGVIVWVVADATVNGSETLTSMRQAIHFRALGMNLHDTMIYHKPDMAFPRYGHRKYCGAWEYMFVFTKGNPKAWNPINDRRNAYAGGKLHPTVRTESGEMKRSHSYGRTIGVTGARNNVWAYGAGYNNGTTDTFAYEHPAIFPEALAKDHILSWSNPGDVVLDPFSGSGTTCKAAKELNREWCGIEINPDYCAIANARLCQEVMQLS